MARNDVPRTSQFTNPLYPATAEQMHLKVPEQSEDLFNDESPIDRYGPQLRNTKLVARQSSNYSRDTEGHSLVEHDAYAEEYENDNDNNAADDFHPSTRVQWAVPAPLCVNSTWYGTQHGNDSKLILQGLSDPLAISRPEPTLQPREAVASYQRTQSPTPPAMQEVWLDRSRHWTGTTFSRSPTPPIRPQRESIVSPSFRTPTSLLSPFKTPPGYMNSSSQFGHYSVDTKTPYLSPKDSYAPKKQLPIIILFVSLTTFCTALDRIIIITALPRITDQFNTIEDIQWYGAAYLLTACSAHLLYGKLYRSYPTKWIYAAALSIFELGSLISAVAPVSAVLILGRALAGLGAAGLLSGGVLIVGQSVQSSQKRRYFAILVSMSSVVLVVGPLIGGALTEYASWRWCFYINLPFGGLSLTLLLFSYNPSSDKSHRKEWKEVISSMDLEGMFLFIPSVLCLLLALQYGGIKYAWTSATVVVLFAVFVVTIVGFGVIQNYKNKFASVPPRLFKNRNVYGGMIASFCLGASFSVMLYYLPLWIQTIKNTSPSQSGLMLLPLLLSMAITSIVSGNIINLVGYYTPFILFASVIMSVGGGLFTTVNENTSTATWIGYQILFGIGAGSGMQQSMVAVQASFKRSRDVVTGITLMTFAQMLGGAVAIAIAQSVFVNKLHTSIQEADIANVDAKLIVHTGTTDLKRILSGGDLTTVLRLYGAAIDGVFFVAMGLAAVSILGGLAMDWHSVKGKGAWNSIYLFR
ncbi:hypothetical protein UA08_06011 [Talaromyces atroroseus]|uniref:Major facilitator superfamily (MFS) profile domain-containing protein n=1 Tax=Talaromyces atroroseus TaxID=1441469 RepID=A0A225ABD4_TALAT|nr:hypothetical protein UA08_06011 [Talaromyces atroroseus]OKL58351.1 hypothetical protein UA08_06011 [Talaromyces atroroseus]